MYEKRDARKEECLKIEKLSIEYRTFDGVVKALNGFELRIRNGETHGLVGETGAGKTTAALAVMGLIPHPPGMVTGGKIVFQGDELLSKTEAELRHIRGRKISMIFQDPMTSLNPVLSVDDQIAEVVSLHQKTDHNTALKRAHEMLEIVGIPASRGKEYPHQFSGGMKQRVMIAIALSCNPDLLIADEPTTALDVTIQAQVLEKIKEIKKNHGTSLLMITHDLGIVAEICDTVSIIYAGCIIETGGIRDIFGHNLHPYTQGLFDSLPNLKDRRRKLHPIRGLMPDPTNLPTGCAFCTRCNFATDQCTTERPPRVYRNENHYVECHLYQDGDATESRVKCHE